MKVFVLSIFILAACGPSQKEPKLADEVLKWKEELEKKSEEKTQSLMGAEQNTSVKKNGYKGQVKSVIVSKFVLTENFGELVKERVSSSSHKYDKKGYTVERVICDANGDIIRKDTFKYDAKGNTPEGVVYSRLSHDADGKIAEKATYKNDAKGNTVEITIYSPNGDITSKDIYKYGLTPRKNKWWVPRDHLLGTMNMLENVRYDANGKITSKHTNKCDAKGNRLESVNYKPNGEITHKYTYNYDAKGNMLEYVRYDAKGKITLKDTLKYDAKGNKVERVEYKLSTGFGEKRFIRTVLRTWDYTYWD